jgi:hypothetical protein
MNRFEKLALIFLTASLAACTVDSTQTQTPLPPTLTPTRTATALSVPQTTHSPNSGLNYTEVIPNSFPRETCKILCSEPIDASSAIELNDGTKLISKDCDIENIGKVNPTTGTSLSDGFWRQSVGYNSNSTLEEMYADLPQWACLNALVQNGEHILTIKADRILLKKITNWKDLDATETVNFNDHPTYILRSSHKNNVRQLFVLDADGQEYIQLVSDANSLKITNLIDKDQAATVFNQNDTIQFVDRETEGAYFIRTTDSGWQIAGLKLK